MRDRYRISVIIPVLNEAQSIAAVLNDIPDWVDEVIVADNGSTDGTPAIAEENGARVIHAQRRGYGSACLAGIAALNAPDIVVFLDGDHSDHPEQMPDLIDPILKDQADLVIGSRALGNVEPGALTPQARFGNKLACFLMRLFWRATFTDLGPFRAIRYDALMRLNMADPDYGWTVEMQIKALLHNLRYTEIPAHYRKRIGRSKVSGTVRGVVGAGYKILSTIFISAARHHLFGDKTSPSRARLILFTRYPVPGETKTRLIPALGPEAAADLQRHMTEHAVDTASRARNLDLQIHYTGADEDAMREWLGYHDYREQSPGDLGQRMKSAVEQAIHDGYTRALIIGIDCPAITTELLDHAVDALTISSVVIGPATDGGYYLIGARAEDFPDLADALFTDIHWGAETVFPVTTARLNERSIPWRRLCPLRDIDEPEDLPEWHHLQPNAQNPRLSIIIPALNEADSIAQTLAAIPDDPAIEVLLIDGGSSDNTAAIAEQHGARVVPSPKGRATQMNTGTAHAHGEVLLFLHADTTLPPDFLAEIDRILAIPDTSLGAFRFSTDDTSPSMRVIAATANLRARWLNLPYGDQALFLRRDHFRLLDGYADLPVMEDFDLVRRATTLGRIRIARTHAVTCARRWKHKGPFRAVLLNQRIVLGWCLGISPTRLARWYRGKSPDR